MKYCMSHKKYRMCRTQVKAVKYLYFIRTNGIIACMVATFQTAKSEMTLFWLIPVCAERGWIPSVVILAIAASNSIDVSSFVFVFGYRNMIPLSTEPVLLNFSIIFATVMGCL